MLRRTIPLLLVWGCAGPAAAPEPPPVGTAPAATFDWAVWDQLLRARVKPTTIGGIELAGFDYTGVRADRADRAGFDALVARLATYDPAGLPNRAEQLAFWINVYNLGAVKLMLDHPGRASIKDLGSVLSSVWKRDALVVGGEPMSLDTIEHGIVRSFGEPRVHFAVVCASVSCPDLRAEAFNAAKLEAQLEAQTRAFLANAKKGLRVDAAKKTVTLSKILDWFAKDFDGPKGVLAFVAKRLPAGADLSGYAVDHFDYDWRLNGR